MQKHNDAMKTSRHSSLEKYTSLFIWKGSNRLLKVLLCERWVGDWTELQHIDPPILWPLQPFFPVLLGSSTGGLRIQSLWDMFLISASSLQLQLLNRGPEGPLCWVLVLSSSSYLQLTRTSYAPSYIIVLRLLNSTCRQSRLSPWYLRPDAPVIYTGAFPILTARPGSVCKIWMTCIFFLSETSSDCSGTWFPGRTQKPMPHYQWWCCIAKMWFCKI